MEADYIFPKFVGHRRRLPQDHDLFFEGNTGRELLAKQAVMQDSSGASLPLNEDEESLLEEHRYACRACKAQLPSEHLLAIHVAEAHDSFFAAQAARKQRVYQCLVEGCRPLFASLQERTQHLSDAHRFPGGFQYGSMHLQRHQGQIRPLPPPFNASQHSQACRSQCGELSEASQDYPHLPSASQSSDANCADPGAQRQGAQHAIPALTGRAAQDDTCLADACGAVPASQISTGPLKDRLSRDGADATLPHLEHGLAATCQNSSQDTRQRSESYSEGPSRPKVNAAEGGEAMEVDTLLGGTTTMGAQEQKHEDKVLSEVLAVTLDSARHSSRSDPPTSCLADVAEELRNELGNDELHSPAPLLHKDILDRVLMSRLLDPPAHYPQWPVHYLLGCYERASQQMRPVGSLKDKTFATHLQLALSEVKDLAVRYTGLLLTMDDSMFEQPEGARLMGPLQLGQSMDAAAGKSSPGVAPLPNGFLEDFAARSEPDIMDAVFQPIAAKLASQLLGVSIAGTVQHTLQHWLRLSAIRPIAAAITRHPMWLTPYPTSGRTLMYRSLLGPLFCLNVVSDAMMDPFAKDPQPSIAEQEFSNMDTRSPNAAQHCHDFLRTPDAREPMIKWLAAAVESCAGRIKIGRNIRQLPSDAFVLTLNAILLKLCDPFVDPSANKAWSKLDLRYLDSGRLDSRTRPS
ncbi:hypothetical protein WJX84_011341 [Apatococcus fuscideae]|uniref:C2H2-type domain-containing protein n=1 Tax=Apatococcus fuscideae TaxID=2026836 RepID=A0AAW1S9B6_9CHLO